jgi:hypothetical protein
MVKFDIILIVHGMYVGMYVRTYVHLLKSLHVAGLYFTIYMNLMLLY